MTILSVLQALWSFCQTNLQQPTTWHALVMTWHAQPLKFLETKNWLIAVWAACVKKNIFFSIFSFGWVNYIFYKLSVNTKHVLLKMGIKLIFPIFFEELLEKKKKRRTPGPRTRCEWSVLLRKAPPQCAQYTGSRHRPSLEGGRSSYIQPCG
jgi:hypothetical protein